MSKSWVILLGLGLSLIFVGSALAIEGDDAGVQLYQQWCSTCHGDRGQGLTEEWRSTWPPGKQNCWQSKCHASNHPPGGFVLPKTVPALIGDNTLIKFTTAQDLYLYMRATMPYWAPDLLSDNDYLAITSYLVQANYLQRNLAPPVPWPQDLTTVSLQYKPEISRSEQFSTGWSWISVALIISGILMAVTIKYRKR